MSLPIYLNLIPSVISLVQAFEGHGTGEEKKQAVLGTIGGIIAALPEDKKQSIVHSDVIAHTTTAIEVAVNIFNMLGVFKKK